MVELEKGAQSSFSLHDYPGTSTHAASYPCLRQDGFTFLAALASHVYGLGEGEEAFLGQVMEEVVQTLVFFGPLHQMPHHVITAASAQGNKVGRCCTIAVFAANTYTGDKTNPFLGFTLIFHFLSLFSVHQPHTTCCTSTWMCGGGVWSFSTWQSST